MAAYNVRAQNIIKGTVIDINTKQPLAFASVKILNQEKGAVTDIDGKFSLTAATDKNKKLQIKYIGYKTAIINIEPPQREYTIYLQHEANTLIEVVVANKENPAHRIIDSVLRYKDINNQENYKTYSYNSYTKAVLAATKEFWDKNDRLDSISEKNAKKRKLSKAEVERIKKKIEAEKKDTVKQAKRKAENESLDKMDSLIRQNYLFASENYTKRYYQSPNRTKEIIEANKISGFDKPNFAFAGSNFQPFGFYSNFIKMLNKEYQSPLTNGCKNDYKFRLIEKQLIEGDTVFIITYKPKNNKNFLGLKGTLHISSNNWAISSVIAEPANDKFALFSFKIQQLYQKQEEGWFPKQLNTIINQIDSKTDSTHLYWDAKTYISNVAINKPLPKNIFDDISVDFDTDANQKKDSVWEKWRADTLDNKLTNTYKAYSLMPQKAKNAFNKIPAITEALALEAIPWGKVDIPFRTILAGVNRFEKLRLGFGLQTNEYFNKRISLGGFLGYGTSDKAWKYGANFRGYFNIKRTSYFELSYKQTIEEPGNVPFFVQESKALQLNSFRNFLANKMDSVKQIKLGFYTKPLFNIRLNIWMQNENRSPSYNDYAFDIKGDYIHQHRFINTEVGFGLKYSIGESYLKMGRAKILAKQPTTEILFQASAGVPNIMSSELQYQKIALQWNQFFTTRKFGITQLQLNAGKVFGDVPYAYMFNVSASRDLENRRGNIVIPNTFQTVGLYEFAANEMITLHHRQEFGSLFFKTNSKYSKPEITITNSLAFGSAYNRQRHINTNFKPFDKGLFESGIIVDNIVRFIYFKTLYWGIGLGYFYRYGPNSLPTFNDNSNISIGFKFSLQ